MCECSITTRIWVHIVGSAGGHNGSIVMMLVSALMGRRLHRKIELVRVDLQAERRFHVLARLFNVAGTVATEMSHLLEPVLHLLAQHADEQADQFLRRACLDRFFGH